MALNKVKKGSNMYNWLDFTYNTIKGKCPHGCSYCFMKKWGEQPALHFDEKELKTDLGSGNFIFIGSSCDLFADAIPSEWIYRTLEHCKTFDNKYLFQSKNPENIWTWRHNLPENKIIGTTIESNRTYREMCAAPRPADRVDALERLGRLYKTFLTIEPIMDFDIEIFASMIEMCMPRFVNIGANTNSRVSLTEPSPDKIMELIKRLKKIAEVKIKPNLKRLMK